MVHLANIRREDAYRTIARADRDACRARNAHQRHRPLRDRLPPQQRAVACIPQVQVDRAVVESQQPGAVVAERHVDRLFAAGVGRAQPLAFGHGGISGTTGVFAEQVVERRRSVRRPPRLAAGQWSLKSVPMPWIWRGVQSATAGRRSWPRQDREPGFVANAHGVMQAEAVEVGAQAARAVPELHLQGAAAWPRVESSCVRAERGSALDRGGVELPQDVAILCVMCDNNRCPGPHVYDFAAGGTLTLDWRGPANALVFLAGHRSAHVAVDDRLATPRTAVGDGTTRLTGRQRETVAALATTTKPPPRPSAHTTTAHSTAPA